MEYGYWHDIIIAGILTAVLAASHYVFPLIKKIHWLKPRRVTSFASGLVVAYVFLHMLPQLVESRDHIHELLSKTTMMTQSKDLIIFVAALIGFEIFYFIERLSLSSGSPDETVLKHRYFRIHLGMYFIYNFLITYTLLLSVKASLYYSIIFVISVSLHFILTDNHFKRHYKNYFNYKIELFLIAALVLGYAISIVLYPIHLYIAAVMTAILSGAILYNAFKEEITLTRRTSILWFFIGSVIVGLSLGLHLTKIGG